MTTFSSFKEGLHITFAKLSSLTSSTKYSMRCFTAMLVLYPSRILFRLAKFLPKILQTVEREVENILEKGKF